MSEYTRKQRVSDDRKQGCPVSPSKATEMQTMRRIASLKRIKYDRAAKLQRHQYDATKQQRNNAASSTLTPKRDQKGTKIKLSLLSLHMASKTSLNQGSKCRRKLLICLEQSQSRSEKSISISLRSSINAISLRSSINLNLAPELNPIAPSSIFVSLQA